MQAWASLQDFKQNGAQHGDCVDSNTLTLSMESMITQVIIEVDRASKCNVNFFFVFVLCAQDTLWVHLGKVQEYQPSILTPSGSIGAANKTWAIIAPQA